VQLTDTLSVDQTGWHLTEIGWNPDRAVAVGSNFLCGNGYLGYRGTTPEQGAEDYVALVVTDTYDCADGLWRELTTAPNPLFVAARRGAGPIGAAMGDHVSTSLDLRSGTFSARYEQVIDGANVVVEVERFASYDNLHLLAQRWRLRSDSALTLALDVGIDGQVWSLNGDHLPSTVRTAHGDVLSAVGTTGESGITVAVAAAGSVDVNGELLEANETVDADGRIVRRVMVDLTAGDEVTVRTTAAVVSSNDVGNPADRAVTIVGEGIEQTYDELVDASCLVWDRIWEATDVIVEGDIVSQASLRFSAYHNRISAPAHSDHLPVGARGLSCQAYQGAAFWDQEIYNLPAFLFSEPEIARNLLIYRHRTLDGARRKAQRLGHRGAFFAWISGVTGDELCPDFFFEDVLTGRPIRNHFNVWQMHVSPDVVTTIADYVHITGDEDYLVDFGAEIAFEVARFLRSFVRYDDVRQSYHCIRLLGPDEWHENVDDNAFTNYQTHAALTFAIETHERLSTSHPDALSDLSRRLDLTDLEIDRWRHVRDHLVLPGADPESGLIEQFDRFFELEDVLPDTVAERLLDPEEYWGWPNGVAVHTQVSKQADVAMLLWLQRNRFPVEVLRANYHYYEPRCSHASSLSHAAFGMVALDIGEVEAAVRHFRSTATIDLLNTNDAVVGGTFIGGIHTAACGGTYQLAVQGFGGLQCLDGRLAIRPVLPPDWASLTYPVRWRDHRLSVAVTQTEIAVTADAANPGPVEVTIGDRAISVPAGESVTV
jgi:kojibiose phosphorylase